MNTLAGFQFGTLQSTRCASAIVGTSSSVALTIWRWPNEVSSAQAISSTGPAGVATKTPWTYAGCAEKTKEKRQKIKGKIKVPSTSCLFLLLTLLTSDLTFLFYLSTFIFVLLPHHPEAQARRERRQDRGRLLVGRAGRAADRFGRVAVGDVEEVEEAAQLQRARELEGLLHPGIKHPDVVFAIAVRRLDVDRRAGASHDQARTRRRAVDRRGPRVVDARLMPEDRRQADAVRRVVAARGLEVPGRAIVDARLVRGLREIVREVVQPRVGAADRRRPLVAVALVRRHLDRLVALELVEV